MGNMDIAMLNFTHLDLDKGWLEYPRPKTGINRRCPLWPETLEALRTAIDQRPEPRVDHTANRVFLTERGRPWIVRGGANPVSVAARRHFKAVGIHRNAMGFYWLRHTFRTKADPTLDAPAIRTIMGHVDDSIDATYTEHIDDERLVSVSDHVRAWLYATTDKGGDR